MLPSIVTALVQRITAVPPQQDVLRRAVLATDMTGEQRWVQGQAGQVWTLDDSAVPGWRKLPLIGSMPYQAPVQPLQPPQAGLVQISVGTLLSLTTGMQSLQAQVEALRARQNDEIAATERINANLRATGVMQQQS